MHTYTYIYIMYMSLLMASGAARTYVGNTRSEDKNTRLTLR